MLFVFCARLREIVPTPEGAVTAVAAAAITAAAAFSHDLPVIDKFFIAIAFCFDLVHHLPVFIFVDFWWQEVIRAPFLVHLFECTQQNQ